MKLLLDENLSDALKLKLADLCPTVAHVKDYGLLSTDDTLIWERAKADGFTIVSKDEDFLNRAAVLGPPPQVILIRLGNCSVAATEAALRRAWSFVLRLHARDDASVLLISPDAVFFRIEPAHD